MTVSLASDDRMPRRIGFGFRSNGKKALLASVLLAATSSSTAATFIVNNRLDAGTGGCTVGECTLREAITAANGNGNPGAIDTINFTIASPIRGEILIQPASPLPTITQPVTINGYSQGQTAINTDPVASNAVIRIRVDGLNAGGSATGFSICANNVTLKGLSITRFGRNGITFGQQLDTSSCGSDITSGFVKGNFIGLTGDGTTAAGNLLNGIDANDARIAIGSTLTEDRNLVSSNVQFAISVSGSAANGLSILGNLIGTDKSGALDRGNGASGIAFGGGNGGSNIVGIGAPNRIAFNGHGITVLSSLGNRLFANHIGPNDDLGIDLADGSGFLGVSSNDDGDADAGGNGQQNHLDDGFTAERTPGGIRVQGALRRSASGSQTFTIAAYASSACDPSGHGEGEQFLATATEGTTTGIALIDVDFPLATPPPAGSFITTTVTAPNGSTSEFSTCEPLDPPSLVVNSTNDVDDGACNAAHCSLREAILASNGISDPKVISFAIDPSVTAGELVIQPTTGLPTITTPVLIDGYTQSGTSVNTDAAVSNALLRIRLDGLSAGLTGGLAICSDGVTVRGLSVTRFALLGISFGATGGGNLCPAAVNSGQFLGNFVGLATDGTTAAGNSAGGILVAEARIAIGTISAADRNVIGSNAALGIEFFGSASSGSSLTGNLLGTDKGGTGDRGHVVAGILIDALVANLSIGEPAAPNLMRFNGDGIAVEDVVSATGNRWAYNRIFDNDAEGIDLRRDAVTLNDAAPDDPDTGPNGLQNFPVITRAERSDAGIVIVGTLDVKVGVSNVPYTIGVYANTACDASGHGEGERLLGAAIVNLTQTSGESFSFELTTADPLEVGVQITTTATGPEGSSEFSACVAATDAPPGIAVNSTNDPGTGICDAGECTLREAITLANTQVGADLIRFEIPGDGPHVILLASSLPSITEALTVDGYTQAGASTNAAAVGSDAVLKIELRDATTVGLALTTCASDVTIRGLSLTQFGTAIATRFDLAATCALASTNVRVLGNYIGVRPDGSAAGNATGILVTSTVAAIGGSELGDRNLVSGNSGNGVIIRGDSDGSTVQNNLLGTGTNPAVDLGNDEDGVQLDGVSNVTVGGEGGLANVLAFNGTGVGVRSGGTGNRVFANEYTANDSLGIDLSNTAFTDGVTSNDVNDVDAGPNKRQNFPVLNAGSASAASITIEGTLDVPSGIVAPLAYTLAFYESAACDGSGNGEGELYLGSRLVDFASDAEEFLVTFAMPPSAGATVITATATDPDGNTSEFSNCIAGPQPLQIFADGFE